jgi:peptide/nickel transport system substrate-binding protein
MVIAPEMSGQVEALRRGELGYVGGLTTEIVKSLAGSRGVKILSVDSNMHWAIRLRSDRGPAADNRVRLALKLATSHQALVDAIRVGLASVGNGFTPVGPAYGRYHLVRPPFTDLARARELLAQAGYPDGLRIVLHAQDQLDAVSIAAAWKQQLARIGVEVAIRMIPSEAYYGGGDESWLEVDFGITDWGTRATPVSYFKLAYTTGAPWNESHWSDPAFDALVARIDREMREGRRVGLYHQAQEILIERGPLIVPYFVKAVAGIRSDLQGVSLASDWPRTRFRDARFGP